MNEHTKNLTVSALQPPAAWLGQLIQTGKKRTRSCPSRQALLQCVAGDAPPPTDRAIAGHLSGCDRCCAFVQAVFWNILLFHRLCEQDGWQLSSGSRRSLRFWQEADRWIDVPLAPLGMAGQTGVAGVKLSFPDIGSLFITATGEHRKLVRVWMEPYPTGTKVKIGLGADVFVWHELYSGSATSVVAVKVPDQPPTINVKDALGIALQVRTGTEERVLYSGRPVPILVAAASMVKEDVRALLPVTVPGEA